MRNYLGVVIACAFLALAACGSRAPAIDPSAETFVIQAAAGDFRRHVAPSGADFRNVHIGVTTGSGLHLLCGQYRAPPDNAWIPFATIQTSDYENWLGETAHCRADNATLDTSRDLAPMLAERYRTVERD